jgi:hypothetical protein
MKTSAKKRTGEANVAPEDMKAARRSRSGLRAPAQARARAEKSGFSTAEAAIELGGVMIRAWSLRRRAA